MLEFHDLREYPNDLPNLTSWYVFKVKYSDDFNTVFGFEKIKPNKYDTMTEVICPL